MTVTAIPFRAPPAGGDAATEVVAAVAACWPSLGVADLSTVLEWTLRHDAEGSPATLIGHLLDGADLQADPRVVLTLRMAAPFAPAAGGDSSPAAPEERAELGRRWFVPHRLIHRSDVSDCAVQVWLVLGMHPRVREGAFPLPAWWIAERAGWEDSTGQAAERRVQRAVKELTAAGLVEVVRQPIGGGRTRPAYRRLGEPGERNKEMVTSRDVRGLRPALLRAYLRWLMVMGHRHQTRLSLEDLASRWELSVKQVRRQRDGLVAAGLLLVDGAGTVVDARRPAPQTARPVPCSGDGPTGAGAPNSGRSSALDDREGSGTFLSGGRDTSVGLIGKNYIPTDRHTPVGTSVPSVDELSRLAGAGPTGASAGAAVLEAAHAPPTGRSPSSAKPSRDDALQVAGRIVGSLRWLRDTPPEVRFQARSLLAGQIRRLRHGVTVGQVAAALRDRVDPSDVGDQQCRTIRAVLNGLYADALAADCRPQRGTRQQPSRSALAARATVRPLEEWRSEPLPPEPAWSAGVDEATAYDWLVRFYAHATVATEDDLRALLALQSRVRRRLPEQYQDAADAAAGIVRGLIAGPAAHACDSSAPREPDPLAVLPWLVALLEAPIGPEPDWGAPGTDAGGWMLHYLVHQVTEREDLDAVDAVGLAAAELSDRLQDLEQAAALELAAAQLLAAYRDGVLPAAATDSTPPVTVEHCPGQRGLS